MINIIKQEIEMEKGLKQRLEFICDFCNTTTTFININIRKIDKINLNYIGHIELSLKIYQFHIIKVIKHKS